MAHHQVIEELSTEAELEASRTEVMATLLGAFTEGTRFFSLRMQVLNKHARIDRPDAFNVTRLLTELEAKCTAHEAASGLPEAGRRAAQDAALEFSPELSKVLGMLGHMSKGRIVQKLRRDGCGPAADRPR